MLLFSSSVICSFKQHLIFLIDPVEFQINYSDGLPMVWNLPSCTVDNVTDFVRHNEFQVLKAVIKD